MELASDIFNKGDRVKSSDEWTTRPFVGTIVGFSRCHRHARVLKENTVTPVVISIVFLDRI